MLVKRRKRDAEKDLPFGVAREVGRKVGIEDKAKQGWKAEPKKQVEKYPGVQIKNIKGKEIIEEEI